MNLKKFKSPVVKDTMGVVTLASLLDHIDYLEEMFEMNGKSTKALNEVRETVKEMIAVEAGEPDQEEMAERSAKTGDLEKVFGSQLTKAMEPLMEKIGGLEKNINSLTEDISIIKNSKASKRPVGSVAVDKVIEVEVKKGSADVTTKRKEVEDITEEINKFSDEMKSVLEQDPSRQGEYTRKSAELHKKYQLAKKELESMEIEVG